MFGGQKFDHYCKLSKAHMMVWVVLCNPKKFHHLSSSPTLWTSNFSEKLWQSFLAADSSSLCGRGTHASGGQTRGESTSRTETNILRLIESFFLDLLDYRYQTEVFSSVSCLKGLDIFNTHNHPVNTSRIIFYFWIRSTSCTTIRTGHNPRSTRLWK